MAGKTFVCSEGQERAPIFVAETCALIGDDVVALMVGDLQSHFTQTCTETEVSMTGFTLLNIYAS